MDEAEKVARAKWIQEETISKSEKVKRCQSQDSCPCVGF